MKRTKYDFTVLVLDGAFPTGVAAARDILATAELLSVRANASRPRWRLCSVHGGQVPLQGGMTIDTQKFPAASADDASVWIIPGLAMSTPQAIQERLQAADIPLTIGRLRTHARRGGEIAASCSATFLLEAAGLLKHKHVTTSWWLSGHLQALSPTSRVDVNRMICVDGNVTTAGSAFALIEMVMFLLKRSFGRKLFDLTGSMLLIRQLGAQAGYIVPEIMAEADSLIARVTARVESTLPDNVTVHELADEFSISTRTLSRHIRQSTGRSTLALIQSIKIRRARFLLETTRMTMEKAAMQVGYSDATALRRLMKRELHMPATLIR